MTRLPNDNSGLRGRLIEAEQAPFKGWDFSYLDGRMVEDPLPWSYEALVREALPQAGALLDMDTGGGEKLATWVPLPPYTAATEGYGPNVPIARARLEPLGIGVHEVDSRGPLPFAAATFDLITNRHGAYSPPEIARILRPGGRLLTQQVGSTNLRALNERLGAPTDMSDWTLERARRELQEAGLVIIRAEESFPVARFLNVEAIVYLLKAVSWQVPDFCVDRYFDRLSALEADIQTRGSVDVLTHRFLVVGQKPE